MQPLAKIFLKVVLSSVFGLFSIPPLVYGGYLFWCWFRIHTSNVYYADYPYALAALAFVSVGFLSWWATLYGVWKRSYKGSLLAIPIFIGLVSMELIPDIPPRSVSSIADTNYLSAVNSYLRVYYEANGRFPANDVEFRHAMWIGPVTWHDAPGSAPVSRYKQRGNYLPYQIIVINSASTPAVSKVSLRPGVIYYCVSSDLQEFWVTMTSLTSDFATSAELKHIAITRDEPVEIVHAAGHDYPAEKK